jgi:ParB family transcriptional regulator, chromosome partitioning protein
MASMQDLLAQRKAKQQILEPSSLPGTLPLERILLREQDTRPLNLDHVHALTESIAALGLIQPIAVDEKGQLLAGGHRRAAIEALQATDPEAYTKWFEAGVPVRQYEFDADIESELALAIEASENEKRRDYTSAEVRDLADRLVAAGYHHTQGRAKKGSKALLPSLSAIVGKSERTIYRYLEPPKTEVVVTSAPVVEDGFSSQALATVRSLERLLKSRPPEDIVKLATSLMKKLEREMKDESQRSDQP